ncbi:MAG: hypothetical protein E7473_06905 [Ruminococcaceae bacterium]|nr:hypothetical protein [Oscillospiraceae bacterium]
MIAFLQSEFCNTPLVLIETTYVSDLVNSERVKMRNSMMRKLAEKYGVSIIDFFELSKENQHFLIDGVHFTAEGYEILAKRLLDSLDGIASKRKDE